MINIYWTVFKRVRIYFGKLSTDKVRVKVTFEVLRYGIHMGKQKNKNHIGTGMGKSMMEFKVRVRNPRPYPSLGVCSLPRRSAEGRQLIAH